MINAASSILTTMLAGFSNVLVQLLAARILSLEEFAKFAMAAATIQFLVGFSGTIVSQVDIIRGHRPVDPAAASAAIVLAVLFIGVGLVVMLSSSWVSRDIGTTIGMSIIFASAFVIQASTRMRAFRVAKRKNALLAELLVLITAVSGLFFLNGSQAGAVSVVFVWALANVVGFSVLFRPLRYWGGISDSRNWWCRNRDLITTGSTEFLLQSSTPYLLNWVILYMGGAPALAGYRVVQLVFGAMGNLAKGLNALEMPALSDDPTKQRIRFFMTRNAVVIIGLTTVITILIIVLPTNMGVWAFGESWTGVPPFLGAGALHGMVNALGGFNFQVLRMLGEGKYSLKVRTGTVVLLPVVTLLFGSAIGAVGVAWGLASVAALGYSLRLYRLRSKLRTMEE